MHRALTVAFAAALGCRGGATTPVAVASRADGALPTVTAPWVTGAMRWDGRLNEAAWATARRIGGFVQPGTGQPEPRSQVNGDARVAWSDAGLMVAFEVRDRAAESALPPTGRDVHVGEGASGVEVMLQPGNFTDNREYFEVQVGVHGARWTTRFDDYNRPVERDASGAMHFGHEDWEPAMECGTARTADGYVVEMRIPWAALATSRVTATPRAGEAWRMNLYTFRDGQRDALAWSPLLGQGNFHRAARFGRVVFGG